MNQPSDVTVVIPAAGQVSQSLLSFSSRDSSAMIPINGKPVIYWTLSYLREIGFHKFVLAVSKLDSTVVEFVSRVFNRDLDIKFIEPDRDLGVGYTIYYCKKVVKTSQVLIVLGDTFFRFPTTLDWGAASSFVLVADVKESYRWCLVSTDKEGFVEELIDKPLDYNEQMKAIIGVYAIEDWDFLIRCFGDGLQRCKRENGRKLEMSDGLGLYKQQGLVTYECDDWYDCGNIDNLMHSQRRLLQAREFNTIKIDELFGTITKQSRLTDKFSDEIQYYQLLPSDLKILFPRILDSNPHGSNPFITMEYYGYPSLSELFVFEKLNNQIWHQIFEHLLAIVNKFSEYGKKIDINCFEYMYRHRVEERVQQLCQADSPVKEVIEDGSELIINGQKYKNFRSIWPQVQKRLACLAHDEDFTVIHGDLCFSNILYDLNSRLCKLIDPRGSFWHKGVYGDIKYDIAKLYHSVHGCYDYITNDLFSISKKGDEIKFEVYVPKEIAKIRQAFDNVFFTKFDHLEILLLEGLLFITMGVFHYDYPERQLAMYVTGIRIWNEVLQNENLY